MIELINIKDVQDSLALSINVDEAKYNQFIIAAQIKDLSYLIGTECVDDLEAAICSNTLDQYQEALYELVKPFLVNWSYSHYVKQSMLISTKSGVTKLAGDNQTDLTDTEKKQASEFYSNIGQAWGKKIIDLLENDKDNYPCFHSSGKCSCCGTKDSRSIFTL